MLHDYSESNLESAFEHIMDYSCVQLPNNVTRVMYYTMPGKHVHWFSFVTFGLVSLAVGAVDGLTQLDKRYKTHYFDTSSGHKISKEEVDKREK
jgi:hypothetical protein